MAATLTPAERLGLRQLLEFGLQHFEAMENVLIGLRRGGTSPKWAAMFGMARSNLLDSCDAASEGRFGEAAFSAQQAVEKALKSVLIEKGASDADLRRIGHKLGDALSACGLPAVSHERLRKVCDAMGFPMGVRYGEVPVDAPQTVRLIHGGAVALGNVAVALPRAT